VYVVGKKSAHPISQNFFIPLSSAFKSLHVDRAGEPELSIEAVKFDWGFANGDKLGGE
jgi:hypothetical protein